MPMLFRSKNLSVPNSDTKDCSSTYQSFDDSRTADKITITDLQPSTEKFKTDVISRLPAVKVGEYCVFMISELQALLAQAPTGSKHVQVHNAINDQGYAVMYIVPENPDHSMPNSDTAIMIEAFPCPPHPACPKSPFYSKKDNSELFLHFSNFKSITPTVS